MAIDYGGAVLRGVEEKVAKYSKNEEEKEVPVLSFIPKSLTSVVLGEMPGVASKHRQETGLEAEERQEAEKH